MRKVMVTERLTLRQLELHDSEAIEKWAGEKDVGDTTLNMPHPNPTGSATTLVNHIGEVAIAQKLPHGSFSLPLMS